MQANAKSYSTYPYVMLQDRPIPIVIQLLPKRGPVTIEYLSVLLVGGGVRCQPRRTIRQHIGLECNMRLHLSPSYVS